MPGNKKKTKNGAENGTGLLPCPVPEMSRETRLVSFHLSVYPQLLFLLLVLDGSLAESSFSSCASFLCEFVSPLFVSR